MFMYIVNNTVVVTLTEDPSNMLPLFAEFDSPGLVDVYLDQLFGDQKILYTVDRGTQIVFTPLGFGRAYNCYVVRSILDMWVYTHDMLLAGSDGFDDGGESMLMSSKMLDDLISS